MVYNRCSLFSGGAHALSRLLARCVPGIAYVPMGRLSMSMLLQSVSAFLGVYSLWGLRNVVDSLVDGNSLWAPLSVVLLSAIGAGSLDLAARSVNARLAVLVSGATQRSMFEKLVSLPVGFYSHIRSGAILTRYTSDSVGVHEYYTVVIPNSVSGVVGIAFTLIFAAQISGAFLILAAAVPIIMLLVRRTESRIDLIIENSYQATRRIVDAVGRVLSWNGIVLARSNGKTKEEVDRFDKCVEASSEYTRSMLFLGGISGIVMGMSSAIIVCGAVAVWAVGPPRDSDTVGGFVAVLFLMQQMQRPVQQILSAKYPYIRSRAAFQRCGKILDFRHPTTYVAQPVGGARVESALRDEGVHRELLELRVEGLSFRYPSRTEQFIPGLSGRSAGVSVPGVPFSFHEDVELDPEDHYAVDAVSGLKLHARAGDRISIIGPSGAGKSTAAYLLAGLFQPTSGRILLNGHDLSDFTEVERALHVAYVPQSPMLIHGTVRDNLCYSRGDATEQQMQAALESVGLDTLRGSGLESLDIEVGESGGRLSGGQRQRLALAQAMLRDTAVVVLDEPTSSLDATSTAGVNSIIETAFRRSIVIVISHRLSTVESCQSSIVMEAGGTIDYCDARVVRKRWSRFVSDV